MIYLQYLESYHTLLKLGIHHKQFARLQGDSLRNLQQLFENTRMLIIDEYTMLDGERMEEINDRLKQAKHCAHLSFGGIAILFDMLATSSQRKAIVVQVDQATQSRCGDSS